MVGSWYIIEPVLQINVGKIDHLTNIIGKTGLLHGEIGMYICFYAMYKNKLRQITELKMKSKTIKVIKAN